jgi:hypothetical protein
MLGFRRGIVLAIATLALSAAGPAGAQESLDQGKSPAQLFASDCALCHKTTQGLSRAKGVFGLKDFLREHYTASKESAAAIAAYVEATDKGPPPAKRTGTAKRTPKDEAKAKEGEKKQKTEKKPEARKPAEAKAGKTKSDDAKSERKSGERGSSEAKAKADEKKPDQKSEKTPAAGDSKPSDAKASKSEAGEEKPATPKPAEAGEPKANDAKPDTKSGDKEKSD